MKRSDAALRLYDIRGEVRSWLALWGVPELEGRLRIEWSWRLRRSLGRAFPQRCLVRLSPLLLDSPRELLLEAVCHEVAHVAVPLLSRSSRPHGRAWNELMQAARFVPRIRVPIAAKLPPKATPTSTTHRESVPARRLYLHACPICHLRRIAKRSIPRWRCRACLDAGLNGHLTITPLEARSR